MVFTDFTELHALQRQVKALQERAVNTENRLHHENLRILGLPEKSKGAKPAKFDETFLANLLGLQNLPPTFVVERAHRVPPTPLTPSHPFLLRLLNYRGWHIILASARNMLDLHHDNAKISIILNYSQKVQQRRRRTFTEVCRRR